MPCSLSLFLTDMDFFMLSYFLFFLYCLFRIFCKLVKQRHHACYILHYECYKPNDDRKLTAKHAGNIVLRNKNLSRDELRFLLRVMIKSGISEESYGPQNFFGDRQQSPSLSDGMLEMEEFFYHTLDKLFSKSKISPSEIDLLVINNSTFSPAPSLAARIVNHYKMRDNIKIFNLTGMGCSASLISINLVQNMFKTYKNLLALVLSTESIAPNMYLGKEKSMMLTNVLFRSGGTAILLTNKTDFRQKAMFKLKYLVRTHLGANDDAYQCVMQKEDDDGYQGIALSPSLPKVVAQALNVNLRKIAPKILPLREILRYMLVSYLRKTKTTINFKTSINHFVFHTGGKEVINGLGKYFGLNEYDLEPSKMGLHRFGNTSASSVWYVLAYMDAKKRLKKGDAILMINPGGGFKLNSCVLEVVRDLNDDNVWKDCIARYPPENTVNPYKEKYGWIADADPQTFKILLEKVRDLNDDGGTEGLHCYR